MSIDLVFVLKWVRSVIGWAFYIFHLFDYNMGDYCNLFCWRTTVLLLQKSPPRRRIKVDDGRKGLQQKATQIWQKKMTHKLWRWGEGTEGVGWWCFCSNTWWWILIMASYPYPISFLLSSHLAECKWKPKADAASKLAQRPMAENKVQTEGVGRMGVVVVVVVVVGDQCCKTVLLLLRSCILRHICNVDFSPKILLPQIGPNLQLTVDLINLSGFVQSQKIKCTNQSLISIQEFCDCEWHM